MIPWKNGKPTSVHVWDATCPDTLAISYRSQATSTSSAGAVADLAEGRKADKYSMEFGGWLLFHPCSH